MKISVIVPVYNVEKYLRQCLTALVNQTHRDLEIICVEDCSTDNPFDILNEFMAKDNRIRLLRHNQNSGLPTARNTGLDAATGDYIHFMDSDDYIYLDYYEKMLAALGNTRHGGQAGADIVSSGAISNDGEYEYRHDNIICAVNMTDKIVHSGIGAGAMVWRFLFKREFVNAHRLRFNPAHKFFEDGPFMWPALEAANMLVTAPGAYYYYVHYRPGNITGDTKKKIDPRMGADFAWAWGIVAGVLRRNGLPSSILKGNMEESRIKLFGWVPIARIVRIPNKRIVSVYVFGIKLFKRYDRKVV